MAIQAQLCSENLGFPSSNPQDVFMENDFRGLTQRLMHHAGISMAADHQTVSFKHELAYLVEKQRIEMNQLVITQNERMKGALQEQSKRVLSLTLKKYEEKIEYLLRQKDEEIAKAVNKRMELEDFMKRVELENQAWIKIAKENEEMVFSLNNTIEQLKASAYLSTNKAEDAESCCDVKNQTKLSLIQLGGVGSFGVEENLKQISKKVLCKGCNIRSSCIIILPCRHLCLCQSCEAFLHSCPVCGREKKSTIQALI